MPIRIDKNPYARWSPMDIVHQARGSISLTIHKGNGRLKIVPPSLCTMIGL